MLRRDDDYAAAGKPACDYDDAAARDALVDALARDARAVLAALDGQELGVVLTPAAQLLAAVTGQDLDEGSDGVFRIARRVAKDRIISTVDLLIGDDGGLLSLDPPVNYWRVVSALLTA